MSVDFVTLIGVGAGICSTMSFTPQAWQIIRSRHTRDISTAMYAITVTGFGLWTVYGVALGKWPLVVANGICVVMAGFILLMKLLPQRAKNAVADEIAPKENS